MSNQGLAEFKNLPIVPDVMPEFKNPDLREKYIEISDSTTSLKVTAITKQQQIASVFAEINRQKLYEGQYESISDFGEKVFRMDRNLVSIYVNAGKVYNNPELPEAMRNLSPFHLNEVKSLKDNNLVAKAFESGELPEHPTQQDLRKFSAKIRNKNSGKSTQVVDRFYVVFYHNGIRTDLSKSGSMIMADFESKYVYPQLGIISENLSILQTIGTSPVEITVVDSEGKSKTVKHQRKIYFNTVSNDTIVAVFEKHKNAKNGKSTTTKETIELRVKKATPLYLQGLIDADEFKVFTGKSPEDLGIVRDDADDSAEYDADDTAEYDADDSAEYDADDSDEEDAE